MACKPIQAKSKNICGFKLKANVFADKYFRLTFAVTSPKIWGGQKIWGAKTFDFRRITLFYLGYRFSKHKIAIYSKNFLGGMPPRPPLATTMAVTEENKNMFNWLRKEGKVVTTTKRSIHSKTKHKPMEPF